VSRLLSRPACWLPLLLLAIGNTAPLVSQVLEKPPTGATSPTVVKAVASLTAVAGKGSTVLDWPAAAGASNYRVTRVDNKGSQEATLYEGSWQNFVFEGKACTVTETPNPLQNCIYEDKAVTKGVLYSYRVWTGGGPSPVASARAK
jgi:hypothetical protein